MADEYVTVREHSEFAKRIDEENKRQNKRIEALEEAVKGLNRLPFLVEQISDTQKKQLAKLEEIESKPIKVISNAKQTLINTIVNLVTTAIVGGIAAILVANIVK